MKRIWLMILWSGVVHITGLQAQDRIVADPVFERILDICVDSALARSDIHFEESILVVEVQELEFFDFQSDSIMNHSKVKKLGVLSYPFSDLLYLKNVPPSQSLYYRGIFIFVYTGLEPLLRRELKNVIGRRAWKHVSKFEDSGGFLGLKYFRARYDSGKFGFPKVESNMRPILFSWEWILIHFDE